MASICNDAGGRKRILFFTPDGRRRVLRLGVATAKTAATFKLRIEQLVTAHTVNAGVIDDELARWLMDLADGVYGRLAEFGLVRPRESLALGAWLDKYLAGRTDLKPSSRISLEYAKGKLLAHFPPETPLRNINPDMAADWRQKVSEGLSVASIKAITGGVKMFFNAAVDRELIPSNPFRRLASWSTPSANEHYIDPNEAEKVIAAARAVGLDWALIFGLARYAGLRVPSEIRPLTWADVDFARARLTVRSPETERHAGHESRVVPISPKLMSLLQEAFDAAPDGATAIVEFGPYASRYDGMLAILRRAEIEAWPKLWQCCRSSAEKEWALTFPQFVVSRWIGHSITVSGKHYTTGAIPDELFAKASAGESGAPGGAVDNAGARNDSQAMELATIGTPENPAENAFSAGKQGVSETAPAYSNPVPPNGRFCLQLSVVARLGIN